MIQTSITISNKLGLHARASAKLTKLAGGFRSDIFISRGDRRVNAKSIMGLLTLAAAQGSRLSITCTGADATEAMGAVRQLVEAGFGEE